MTQAAYVRHLIIKDVSEIVIEDEAKKVPPEEIYTYEEFLKTLQEPPKF